ncbi:hypothetical protein [Actinomyces succiniciruminis]|uniref:Uncharacterized protein n=1 Tax=Actinomyces succiniciruminis TaxID=1522002 RepID=A0A1L7RQB6_9ACTO|nr:hypothetical protein [Actinomyces succiniciruminis]CED92450.1 Hypothetical protein AAM4_2618 [Actinomyces succiniciruminis]
MTSMNRREAVQLKMAIGLWFLADQMGEDISHDHLRALHDQGGQEWAELLHELVSAAHPFAAEDGTWVETVSDHGGEHTVTERIGIDDVLVASYYARQWMTDAIDGFHAVHRAVNYALVAYERTIMREAREVLREALAAEQGLVD